MKKLSIVVLLSAALLLTGCDFLFYMPPIQQGNDLSPAQVEQIHIGMSKAAVVRTIGSPVLINTFRDNISEYVYTYKVRGRHMIEKKLILYFSGDRLTQIDNQY